MNRIRIRTRKTRIRRLRRGLVIAGLLLTGQTAGLMPSGMAGAAESGACLHHQIETLYVTVAAADDVYRLGERATVVTRVARRIGDVLQPVEGAAVLLAASVRQRDVVGGARTTEDGTAVVKLRLRPSLGTGGADVFGYAFKIVADAPCAPQEVGFVAVDRLFRIRGR